MVNTYSRALILTAMTAVSLTQGCSCSGSKNDPKVVEPPVVVIPPVVEPPAATITISGTAAKGLVKDAVVSVCAIVNKLPDCVTPIVPVVTTSALGHYSVSIPQTFVSNPYVLRITATPNTRMICDLINGCGTGISFGADYTPSTAFKLDSLIPSLQHMSVVNVSTLTDIASTLAIHNFQTSAQSISSVMTTSLAQVGDRFGVSGDISKLPIYDLTNTSVVKILTSDDLIYNSLNAAIIAAVQGDNAGLSIESALAKFSTDFSTSGLTNNALTPSVTGLNEILASARTVIDTATIKAGVTATELLSVLDTRKDLANAQVPKDEGTQGTSGPVAGGTDLAKAKAFVATIGDLANSLNMAVLKNDVTVESQSNAFDLQLQAADLAASKGVEQVLEATAKTADAFAEAYDAYADNNALTTWTSEDGVAVTITTMTEVMAGMQKSMAGSVKLAVKQNVSVMMDEMEVAVAVDMMAMKDIDHTESVSSAGAAEETLAGMVAISGTAETAMVKLTVMDDSTVSTTELMTVDNETDTTESSMASIKDLMLKLNVKLEQKVSESVVDPISFAGYISATLKSLSVQNDTTWVNSVENNTATASLTTLGLNLWGSVSNTSGDSATVSFGATGDGTGVDISQDWMGEFSSLLDPETDSSFATANVNLAFMAKLAGISDAVTASYGMSRSALGGAKANLKFAYPGVQMTFSTSYDNKSTEPQKLLVTNQDGVIATFVDGDKITGSIFVGTQKVATISGVTVTYSDDSFELLDILE